MSLVLNVEILGEFKKLNTATKGAEKSLNTLKKGVSGIGRSINGTLAAIGVGFSLNAVVGGIKDVITASSDLTESQNALKVAFGSSAKGLEDFGRNAATTLGLSAKDFNATAVQFSAFAKTVAGDGGDVNKVIKDLSTRGADFASVFNLEVSEALKTFQSGLAGQTEPMRRYGIDLSAAAVKNHALAVGIFDGVGQMTESEKVMARYSLLMEATSMTAGDFANTSDGLANTQRILKAEFENVQAEVGEALLPVMIELFQAIRDDIPTIKLIITEFVNFAKSVADATLFIIKNKETLAPYAGILLSIAVGFKTVTLAMGAYNAIVTTATASTALLKTTLGAALGTIAAVLAGLAAIEAINSRIRAEGGLSSVPAGSAGNTFIPAPGQTPESNPGSFTNMAPIAKPAPVKVTPQTTVPKATVPKEKVGGVTINNNVTVKKSTATGQDIATALNKTIKSAGTNVIKAQ